MKKLVLVLMVLFGSQMIMAQSIDKDRMTRDLEVAKNILATLMKNEMDIHVSSGGIEADYIEGYGVIFTIPKHYVYFHMPPPKIKPPKVNIKRIGENGSIAIVGKVDEESNQEAVKEAQEEFKEAQEEFRKAQEELKKVQEAHAEAWSEAEAVVEKGIETGMKAWGEEMASRNQKFEKAIIIFIADYADLIGQLNPDDKIMINQESPWENFVWTGFADDDEVNSEQPSGFSMEVVKKDISAYKAGNISLEEFKTRIETRKKEPKKRSADLEMFASIFKQYYSPKLSTTFFTEGTPSYEVLEDFGVIYKIKTYSSYVEGNLYYMPVLGKEKVNSEERKKAIEDLYPKFESDIKNFIIDYGRTIRTLEDDDMLILKIKLTRCDECSIPQSIEVSVKMDLLRRYDQQKLSREKAIEAIKVKHNPEG